MMNEDPVPQLIAGDERSRPVTVEFCTERCEGHRCMLVRGHAGVHEALAKAGPLRWESEVEP